MIKNFKLETCFLGLFLLVYVILAIFNASEYFAYFSMVFGFFGLIIAWKIFEHIDDQPEGDEKMMEIADGIHEGAMVFLSRKYQVLAYFICGIFVVLLIVISAQHGLWIGFWTAVAYLMGAFSSMLSGFFGMNAATSANVRTAQAAKEGLPAKALGIAFNGGSIMGICVASMGLIGIGVLFLLFARGESISIINGYALGASSIALFARIGGGIYTKIADIGSELAKKIQAGVQEGNSGEFGVIADNVGNVTGSVADIFESYVGATVATIAIAATSSTIPQAFRFDYMALPLLVYMAGLVVSIVSVRVISMAEPFESASIFRYSTLMGSGAMLISSFFLIKIMGLPSAPFIALFFGCLAGIAVCLIAKYYTEGAQLLKTTEFGVTGVAALIISGLAVAFESAVAPVIVIALAVLLSAKAAGLYGVALAAVGALGTVSINMSIDAQGAIVDNAGRISELAGLEPETRQTIEKINVFRNAVVTSGKAFAIGAAVLTALALFSAYAEAALIKIIDIIEYLVFVGLFFGGAVTLLVAALTISSVGRATFNTVEKINSYFHETPRGASEADTARCIDISTQVALMEMVPPGLIALLAPVFIGLVFGAQALGGMLVGAILTGLSIALFTANAGGIWNNARKYVEQDNLGGKGSDCHRATIVGDTVGDVLKDIASPAMNILIKVMTIVSLVLASLFI